MKHLVCSIAIAICSIVSSSAQAPTEYKTVLKEMFTVSGSEQAYKTVITQMIGLFKAQYTQVPDTFWQEFETELLNKGIDGLTEMLVPTYKTYLSIEDLQTIIAFYKTPTGTKFANSTPLIMQESIKIGETWGMQIGNEIIKKILEKGY